MAQNAISAQRFAEAGIPIADTHWYFLVGEPRGFTNEGDEPRVISILTRLANHRKVIRKQHA